MTPPSRTPPRISGGAIAIAAAALVGGTLGALIVPRLPEPEAHAARPPEVRLLGDSLPLGDSATDEALNRVRRHVAGVFTLTLPEGAQHGAQFSDLGVAIDTVRLTQLVRDARDPTSPLSRTRRRLKKDDAIELPVPLLVEADRAFDILIRLKDTWDRPAKDARLDVQASQVLPEQRGLRLDVDATVLGIRQALEQGETEAEVAFIELSPRRVASDIQGVNFDQVLGYFETGYDRARRAEARTFNLKLAASKLDGTVLLPGEVFDFNGVVGPRDEAHGYKVAPVIAQGELVDGIGGGTCQISGTLHGAAFFAGLDIVERIPHTRPSSYIKMGLDATVVYPTINFRVKNNHDFPVVLHETVSGGKVRAEIRGPKSAATVTLIRRIEDAIPYPELERPDPKLKRGEKVLAQRGVPGFKLKRYRILREGEHAVREGWHDVYPPTPQIVLIGTGSKNEKSTRDDQHPEYTADELLVVTQLRDSDEGPPRVHEEREPGRFGKRGWTKRANMPYYDGD